MQHRTLDSYMESIKQSQLPIAMMTKQSGLEPMFSTLKAGSDSGVIRRNTLPSFMGQDTFDYLKPLFEHWEQNSLVELSEDYLGLTIAGSFWAVSLAQSVIQVLNGEYQATNTAPKAAAAGVHPHASLKHA